MKKIVFSLLLATLSMSAASLGVYGQKETDTGISIDRDLSLMRRDLRSEKKKIIAMTVPFTDEEAIKFWPLYDQYALDMQKPNDEFYALIKDYIANQKVMTDEQCMTMLKRWGELQGEQAKVRQKYIPMFQKIVPGKKVALFFQIDRRLYSLMDLQTSTELPLVYQ